MEVVSAWAVVPGLTRYEVAREGHPQLRVGDVVVVVETPHDYRNLLLRLSDMTLHEPYLRPVDGGPVLLRATETV